MVNVSARVLVVALIAGLLAFGSGAAWAKPAVFENVSMEAATKRGREENKLVVIDAMAEWCGPCKQMDRTTWVNASVVEWMKANCIAVQLDVDKDPQGARRLGVRAMPTVVVFANGKEVDRRVGGLNAKQMLDWLKSVHQRAGLERKVDAQGGDEKQKREQRADAKSSADRERLGAARALAERGDLDGAAGAYVEVWRSISTASIPDAALMGEASADMKALVKRHAPAAAVFAGLRDAVAPPAKTPLMVMPGDLASWAALNEVLGESSKTIAWYDQARSNPGSRSAILRIEGSLGPALVAEARWADVMRVVRLALSEDKARREHVAWLEAAAEAGAGDDALLRETRLKAKG